jgi:hypothetical protein
LNDNGDAINGSALTDLSAEQYPQTASVMPRKTETHWVVFVIVISILVCIVLSSLLHAGSQAIVD